MFTSIKNFDYALIFDMKRTARFENSLHMLFVFYPILAVFLNSEQKVVDKRILTPFQLNYTPKKKCRYIIEIPTTFEKEFKIDDKISW